MARYNRDFLVPYLRNVYALHLAEEKAGADFAETVMRLHECEKVQKTGGVIMPKPPKEENNFSFGRLISILGGVFLIGYMFQICMLFFEDPPSIKDDLGIIVFGWAAILLLIALGLVMIIVPVRRALKESAEYNELLQTYEYNKERAIETGEKNIAIAQRNITALEGKLQKIREEEDRIRAVRDRLYGVNIIPSHYRNLYAAAYLHEWFSTGASDDLDHALSMFVLEEIKARLDKVIENQREIIINQQIQIANQYRSLELQEQHQKQLMAKLDRIEASEDERNRYLRMIDGELSTIAYFSAAEYFRK